MKAGTDIFAMGFVILKDAAIAKRGSLIQFGMITACMALLYFSVVRALVYDWIHLPDFSHCFLIPIVSFYFVYERRKQLSTL